MFLSYLLKFRFIPTSVIRFRIYQHKPIQPPHLHRMLPPQSESPPLQLQAHQQKNGTFTALS